MVQLYGDLLRRSEIISKESRLPLLEMVGWLNSGRVFGVGCTSLFNVL